MNKDILKKRVEELAGKVNGEVEEVLGEIILKIKGCYVLDVLKAIKEFEDVPCDFLHDLGGMDLVDHLEVVYQLTSLRGPQSMRVKAIIDRQNPVVDSVTGIWQGANYMEREAFDMFGIRFKEHPNLKRIYMWDDFEGYPLRKDYVTESFEERSVVRIRIEGE